MKRIAPIFILLIFAINTFAQIKTVTRSKITFEIKNLGIKTGGSIGGLQASVQFDPAQLSNSKIAATIDVNTINSGNDQRDTHLKSDEFFDSARFPKISIRSISFKHRSGDNYTGQFELTMKNRSKQFDIPFTYAETGNTISFKGTLKLNRLDFGVGSSSLVLSNEVTVNIELEMAKA